MSGRTIRLFKRLHDKPKQATVYSSAAPGMFLHSDGVGNFVLTKNGVHLATTMRLTRAELMEVKEMIAEVEWTEREMVRP